MDEIPAKRRERPTAGALGITTDAPKFPQYSLVASRRESYEQDDMPWPSGHPLSVQDLAEAGLVYTGVGDSVRCYYCGGGLKNWERGDNPMVEHARWYADCPHIKLVKGQNFAKNVADGEIPEVDHVEPNVQNRKEIVRDEMLETPAALSVIEAGYTKKDVVKAMHIFYHQKGSMDFKGTDLCSILFDMEDDPSLYTNIGIGTEHSETRTSTPRSSVSDATSMGAVHEDVASLEKENEKIKEQRACTICHERQSEVIYLPCGHMITCPQCAAARLKGTCKTCGKVINGLVKAVYALKTECDKT